MKIDEHIWLDVPGFPLYQASPKGEIRSKEHSRRNNRGTWTAPGKIRKLSIGTTGYYQFTAVRPGNKLCFLKVHRIIATLFVENPDKKPWVNHKDGNKLNNHFSNLEWCTPSENAIHAHKNFLSVSPRGERAGNVKLTEEKVKAILSAQGRSQRELARDFKVSRRAIRSVLDGRSWKHVKVSSTIDSGV